MIVLCQKMRPALCTKKERPETKVADSGGFESARQQRTSQPCGPVAPASADPNLVSNPMPSTNRLFKQVPQAWSFGRVNREILFEACGDFLQAPLDVVIERLHDLGDLFALHRL